MALVFQLRFGETTSLKMIPLELGGTVFFAELFGGRLSVSFEGGLRDANFFQKCLVERQFLCPSDVRFVRAAYRALRAYGLKGLGGFKGSLNQPQGVPIGRRENLTDEIPPLPFE
jgi:hypothetical protein